MLKDSEDPVLQLEGEASVSSAYWPIFPGALIPIPEGVLPARPRERFSLAFGLFHPDPLISISVCLSLPYSRQQKHSTRSFQACSSHPYRRPRSSETLSQGSQRVQLHRLPKLGLPRAAGAYCLNARSEQNFRPPPGQGLPHNPELPRGKQGGATSGAGLGLTLAGAGPPSGPQASRSS